jgi:SAM-dependent methyltransferase
MRAVHGDVMEPSAELQGKDWFGFDVAIMSMALHHVPQPVEMLSRLRERLREGGSLVLVEWLQDGPQAVSDDSDPGKMVEAIGGQQIFPGLTVGFLQHALKEAGFEGVDVRVPGLAFSFPEGMVAASEGREKRFVFAKAVVPSKL